MRERIEKAAIRSPDQFVFTVARPGRHLDVIELMCRAGYESKDMHDQGFVTSNGRFVDRFEGCRIARAARQIKQKTGPGDKLFSEDMW